MASAAEDLGLSKTMLYRLLALYRVDPSPSSILPKRAGQSPGTRRLDQNLEALIECSMRNHYLKRERPRIVHLHRAVVAECHRGGLPPPSYKAIWNRVKQLDPAISMRYREGARKSRERFAPVGPGLRPEMPLDLYQIDHTPADVIVVSELDRKPIGRPWLTLVIDVASRMIAGFHLSLDSPSSASVALAISHAVLPNQKFLAQLELAAD
jgi:putative transposase